MMIHEVTQQAGRYKNRKRVGRGPGSGTGKTCGRGHKGAGSRAGFGGSVRASREGGQMPLFRRLPKRGFNNARFRKLYDVVNLRALGARLNDGDTVGPEQLRKLGLAKTRLPIKILGQGDLNKRLNVSAAAFSRTAIEKITAAGGAAQVV